MCTKSHTLDDHAAYVVVETRFGAGGVRDLERFEEWQYASARVAQREAIRNAPDGHYARLDVIYADGCRGIL